jgi:hypothetical protein
MIYLIAPPLSFSLRCLPVACSGIPVRALFGGSTQDSATGAGGGGGGASRAAASTAGGGNCAGGDANSGIAGLFARQLATQVHAGGAALLALPSGFDRGDSPMPQPGGHGAGHGLASAQLHAYAAPQGPHAVSFRGGPGGPGMRSPLGMEDVRQSLDQGGLPKPQPGCYADALPVTNSL